MIQDNVRQFFSIALERQLIHMRKTGVMHKLEGDLLTEDPVFQQWRFCCVNREDDKTTRWFRVNVREPLKCNPAKVLFATVAFRWFNRIETGEIIKPHLLAGPEAWDTSQIQRLLHGRSPVVTGAYIIKTPNGKNKLDGVLWCIEQVRHAVGNLVAGREASGPEDLTMEGVWEALKMFPYLGDFMAYQIVSDLRHTCWLDRASDAMAWASPGPGSTRGLGWIVADDPAHFSRSNKGDWVDMMGVMRQLALLARSDAFWPFHHKLRWEMQTVQHWLCEYDKYRRAAAGEAQKRRYS